MIESLYVSGWIVFEVLVLKNIGSRSHQPKAHFFFAGITIGKLLTANHHGLMGFAMDPVVQDFVDSRLANCVARAIASTVG
jgi:hypothetical protein